MPDLRARRRGVCFPVLVGLCVAVGLSGVHAADAQDRPEAVGVRVTPAGTYMTDANGMSLYVFLRDSEPGVSTCVDECARTWPPLAAPAEAQAVGQWRAIDRPDGTQQWAYRGQPVYRYRKDSYPGGAFGDNVGNAWRVLFDPITTPPGITLRTTVLGRMLTDLDGMSLYVQAGDAPMCTGGCLHDWLPRPAPAMARDFGDWSIVDRPDGVRQWAFDNQPLYSHVHDFKPGDLAGHEVAGWHAAVLNPPSPRPDWVTIQASDMGQVFADADGMTLYVFVGDLERSQEIFCDAECTAENWRPITAQATDTPVGDWAPVRTADDSWQWTYKGDPVYAHTRDNKPGAIGGDKWATGAGFAGRWDPIRRPLGSTDAP